MSNIIDDRKRPVDRMPEIPILVLRAMLCNVRKVGTSLESERCA